MRIYTGLIAISFLFTAACSNPIEGPFGNNRPGKGDTRETVTPNPNPFGDIDISPEEPEEAEQQGRGGWVADNSYEVEVKIESKIVRKIEDDVWSELATDKRLQHRLVDMQLKYIRNTTKAEGLYLDQLAREVVIDPEQVTVEGDVITLPYTATVDMIKKGNPATLPEDPYVQPSAVTVPETAVVPVDPTNVYRRLAKACLSGWGTYSLAEHKYYYYFAPDKFNAEPGQDDDCDTDTDPNACNCKAKMDEYGLYYEAKLTFSKVHPVKTVYPEYDKLARKLKDANGNETGNIGFTAAILPHLGDNDPKSRFQAHKDILDAHFLLDGESMENGLYYQYTITQKITDDKSAVITVDLYDPTMAWAAGIPGFSALFHDVLSKYDYVQYNGHSNYGAKDLLQPQKSDKKFLEAYQIVVMHSCSSYAYYTDQVFRAKKTDADPTGWANTDVVATGKSSYPSGSPKVMEIMLRGLLKGLVAYDQKLGPDDVDSWQELGQQMNQNTWGHIMYGIAGARTNTWQPVQPVEPE